MLAERAECLELCAAASIPERAAIHPLLVDGTPEVVVQPYECLEFTVAQEALVGLPVPRTLRGECRDDGRRRAVLGVRKHARGYRDDVLRVVPDGGTVDLLTCDTRATGPRLQMEDEGRAARKRFTALLARAAHSGTAMASRQ